MCLLPFGGMSSILIPPTEKARQIANLLRMAIGVHFALVILLFLGTRYVDGAFDMLGWLIGFFSIRNSEGYSFQCVLCYTAYCAMDFFWSCLRAILYFSGASDSSPDPDWSFWIFVISMTIAPFVYTICAITAYYLYKELRNILNDLQSAVDGMGGGMGGASAGGYYNDMDWGGAQAAPYAAGPAGPAGPAARAARGQPDAAASAQQQATFRAFAGQGHRLG